MKNLILIVCFISIPKVFSQIINLGTLKIVPATIVSFQAEYTNAATGTHDSDG